LFIIKDNYALSHKVVGSDFWIILQFQQRDCFSRT